MVAAAHTSCELSESGFNLDIKGEVGMIILGEVNKKSVYKAREPHSYFEDLTDFQKYFYKIQVMNFAMASKHAFYKISTF